MKEAHRLARQLEGEYRVRLSISLKHVWDAARKSEEEVNIDLPELQGSPKQVKWANEIRKELLKNMARIEKAYSIYKISKCSKLSELKLYDYYSDEVEFAEGTYLSFELCMRVLYKAIEKIDKSWIFIEDLRKYHNTSSIYPIIKRLANFAEAELYKENKGFGNVFSHDIKFHMCDARCFDVKDRYEFLRAI
jgi:hypothetical protein